MVKNGEGGFWTQSVVSGTDFLVSNTDIKNRARIVQAQSVVSGTVISLQSVVSSTVISLLELDRARIVQAQSVVSSTVISLLNLTEQE